MIRQISDLFIFVLSRIYLLYNRIDCFVNGVIKNIRINETELTLHNAHVK